MKFITLADLARTIRENMHKVPHGVDFVMGVPRSGVLAASMIAEFLNAPLIDVDSFVFGASPTGGNRMRFHTGTGAPRKRVLVVDDTMFHGRSLRASRAKLEPFAWQYEFIYMVVYLEGPCADVDLWMEDLRMYTENFKSFVLYEWNIFHHIPRFMEVCIYDIDGVLCIDPPDERAGQAYIDYIANAVPLFTPTVKIGEIVSFRLEKYRDVTERWLRGQGIKYDRLTLFPARSWDERAGSGKSAAGFKADIYFQRTWAKLFVESDDNQAREIRRISGKPVYCVQSNKMHD
jgi:uncharacterized HAD superfamily protein